MSDVYQTRTPLVARLAARAVTLAVDASTSVEDAAEHLVRLARGDASAITRAARHVELRHPRPDSALARHAVRMLRDAAALAAPVTTARPEETRSALA